MSTELPWPIEKESVVNHEPSTAPASVRSPAAEEKGTASAAQPDPAGARKDEALPKQLLRKFFSRNPLHWLGAALAFGAVAAVGGGVVASTGLVNLSAVPPHPDGWAHLLHYGMGKSVGRHAHPPAPTEPLDSQAMIMRGAATYSVVCENCHGAPGFGQSPIALSMRPEPPMVVDATSHYSDKELFFIVANGVRYSGMPAYSVQNRPDEVWALVSFLKTTPNMSRETYLGLAHGTASRTALPPPLPNVAAVAAAISPFVASKDARPTLPGDPEEVTASPGATLLPRAGYRTAAVGTNPLAGCVSCHGSDGTGRAGGAFPNLSLQTPQYLYNALRAFASGQRQSGVMWPIAADLSDEEMRTIAAQLGSGPPLPSHDAASGKPSEEMREHGLDIVTEGAGRDAGAVDVTPAAVAPAGVQRCTSCHLPDAYLGQIVPKLEGQYAAYLRMQMTAFREGGRGNTSTYNPMVKDSHNLTDHDIEALAAFYASQRPQQKKNSK